MPSRVIQYPRYSSSNLAKKDFLALTLRPAWRRRMKMDASASSSEPKLRVLLHAGKSPASRVLVTAGTGILDQSASESALVKVTCLRPALGHPNRTRRWKGRHDWIFAAIRCTPKQHIERVFNEDQPKDWRETLGVFMPHT